MVTGIPAASIRKYEGGEMSVHNKRIMKIHLDHIKKLEAEVKDLKEMTGLMAGGLGVGAKDANNLQAERDKLLALLRRIKIQYTHRDGHYCVCCMNPESYGCKPGCALDDALKENE